MSYSYVGARGFHGLGASFSASASGGAAVKEAGKCLSKKRNADACVKAGVGAGAAAACTSVGAGAAAGLCATAGVEIYNGAKKLLNALFGGNSEQRRKDLAKMKSATGNMNAQVAAAQQAANDEWNSAATQIGLLYTQTAKGGITPAEIFKLLTDNGGTPPPDVNAWHLAPYAAFSPGAETSKMARPAVRTKDCNYQVPNPLKGLGASFSWSATVTGGSASGKTSSGTSAHTKCSPSTGGYCYVSPYNKCINDWLKYNNAWRQQRGRDALAKLQVWYDQVTAAKAKAASYILGNAAALRAQEKMEAAARAQQKAMDDARAKALAKPKAPPRPTAPKGATPAQIAANKSAAARHASAARVPGFWEEVLGQGTVGMFWKLAKKSG